MWLGLGGSILSGSLIGKESIYEKWLSVSKISTSTKWNPKWIKKIVRYFDFVQFSIVFISRSFKETVLLKSLYNLLIAVFLSKAKNICFINICPRYQNLSSLKTCQKTFCLGPTLDVRIRKSQLPILD